MKLDPGMHIVMHLVFLGKIGVIDGLAISPSTRKKESWDGGNTLLS
jgi:hypothetical protein